MEFTFNVLERERDLRLSTGLAYTRDWEAHAEGMGSSRSVMSRGSTYRRGAFLGGAARAESAVYAPLAAGATARKSVSLKLSSNSPREQNLSYACSPSILYTSGPPINLLHILQYFPILSTGMSESLKEVWDASAAQPFQPIVSKNWQFLVGFSLLAWAFLLTGIFALNRCIITLPLLGLPASLAFGFGSVFMICAAGVYV